MHRVSQHTFRSSQDDIESQSPIRDVLHFLCLHNRIIGATAVITVIPLRHLIHNVEIAVPTDR